MDFEEKIIIIGVIIITFIVFLIIWFYLYKYVYSFKVGNKQFLDFNYTFTRAIIYLGNEKIEIEIDKWNDYDGEQIQIIDKEGNCYLVSSFNTILIND